MTGENESEKMALQNGEKSKTEKPESKKPETKADKLAALKQKQAQIEAQIKALQAKEGQQKRKEETRLKVLIGAAIMADIEKTTAGNAEAGAKQKKQIKEVLNRAIQRKQEREFLTAHGWLNKT